MNEPPDKDPIYDLLTKIHMSTDKTIYVNKNLRLTFIKAHISSHFVIA